MSSEDGSETNSKNAACYKHGVNVANFVTRDMAL